MSYMKQLLVKILEEYPEKSKEIIADFQAFKEGLYAKPKTKELRKILGGLNEV